MPPKGAPKKRGRPPGGGLASGDAAPAKKKKAKKAPPRRIVPPLPAERRYPATIAFDDAFARGVGTRSRAPDDWHTADAATRASTGTLHEFRLLGTATLTLSLPSTSEHARVEDVLDALAAPVKRSRRLMKRQNYKSKERGVETWNELGEPGHDGNVIPVGKLADAAARGDVCVKERHGGQLLRDLANAQHPVSTPWRVPYLRCVCVNAPTKASPGSSPLPPSLPAVGEVVAKTFEDGKSYRGVVMRVVPEDEYQITVRYDDGDDETYRVADFDKECRPAKNPFATTRSIVKTEAACDGDSSIEFVEEIEVEENAKPLPAWDADANDDGAVTITLACYFGRLAFELIACDEIKFIMRHLTPSAPVRHRVAPPRTDAARRPTFVVDADAAGGSDDPGFCFTLPGLLAAAVTDGYAEAPQPRELALPLMDFQRQTVRWMMDQEAAPRGLNGVFWEERRFADADDDDDDGDDVDGVKTKTAADATRGVKRRGSYWYFPLAGELRLDEPPMSRGGMVCEEMGLGKTIEVLALIAHDLQANRGVKLESETLAAGRWAKQCKPKDALRKEADARGRAAYEEYMESVDEKIRRGEITIRDAVSEACEAQKSARAAIPDDRENGSVPSRATLVVVPPPLLRQWEAEVKKCLNESSLALVVYGGKGGGEGRREGRRREKRR